MKKSKLLFLILLFLIGGFLIYRNQKIECTLIDAEYQTVIVREGLLIEEPVLDFELPENAQLIYHYITTDSFIPVLALYNRNAEQVFTNAYLYHHNTLASMIRIIETKNTAPVEFHDEWTLLETNEKASLSFSEDNDYKHYQIRLKEKEIRITFDKRNDFESVEPEIIECIMKNYQRLSQ